MMDEIRQEIQGRLLNVASNIEDTFQKGGGHPEGTIKIWSGERFQKTNGQWKYLGKADGVSKKEGEIKKVEKEEKKSEEKKLFKGGEITLDVGGDSMPKFKQNERSGRWSMSGGLIPERAIDFVEKKLLAENTFNERVKTHQVETRVGDTKREYRFFGRNIDFVNVPSGGGWNGGWRIEGDYTMSDKDFQEFRSQFEKKENAEKTVKIFNPKNITDKQKEELKDYLEEIVGENIDRYAKINVAEILGIKEDDPNLVIRYGQINRRGPYPTKSLEVHYGKIDENATWKTSITSKTFPI